MHAKMQVFLAANAHVADSVVWKKLCLERTPPEKKTAFLHTIFVENERETSELKYGTMFSYEIKGHLQKLSSFGRVKKNTA